MEKFEVTEKQTKQIDKWTRAIKLVFGEVGDLEYRFGVGSGIGVTLKVYSKVANKEKDFTDYDSW